MLSSRSGVSEEERFDLDLSCSSCCLAARAFVAGLLERSSAIFAEVIAQIEV